ncbi:MULTISPECIES: peptidase [Rhizobium/Agrobacterium group]|uniref:peptidase n=1 Tax=Rhizobium/Agrobacterium group TaxID=227290 RepID=UPI0015735DF1|nr:MULTISPECIES: peptidase [Rhizobium/Agrobacterium group]MCF1446633.1 peptidase [Allorhizobium ampelinum]NSZ53480.1 peptidase [Agrobacterium vitis]NTA32239.1 peptidase [Agrobacterium vitis]
MKPINIFRSGNHTDSRGRQFAFSDADLQAVASQYDPALHHAPIVVGHPKDDHPAYGWVKSIAFKDGELVAEPEDIEPQFAELVKARRYRKVSASFYSPEHPNNPVPGKYYLRHVGFLGAAAPAVKGLKAVEFTDDEDVIEFEDAAPLRAAWAFEMIARTFRTLRESIIAEKGVEAADAVIPAWNVDALNEAAQQSRDQVPPVPVVSYSENSSKNAEDPMDKEQQAALKAREDALAKQEADFAEKVKSDEAERSKIRAAEDTAFVDQLCTAGRLPVGLKPLATALFADLSDSTISFSEDGAEKSVAPRQGLRDLLSKMPFPVATGELATGDGPDFSDPLHVKDAINIEIAAAKGRGENLSAAEAAMRLTKR